MSKENKAREKLRLITGEAAGMFIAEYMKEMAELSDIYENAVKEIEKSNPKAVKKARKKAKKLLQQFNLVSSNNKSLIFHGETH